MPIQVFKHPYSDKKLGLKDCLKFISVFGLINAQTAYCTDGRCREHVSGQTIEEVVLYKALIWDSALEIWEFLIVLSLQLLVYNNSFKTRDTFLKLSLNIFPGKPISLALVSEKNTMGHIFSAILGFIHIGVFILQIKREFK